MVIFGFENNGQIFLGKRRSQNDVKTRGNSDTLAFPQIGLQRNAKYIVKVHSTVIKVKCLISYIVICIGESVIHQLKSNIVTALFTTSTSRILSFGEWRFLKNIWKNGVICPCVPCSPRLYRPTPLATAVIFYQPSSRITKCVKMRK